MNRTTIPTPFPPATLAQWCREDGHDGCAILIEEAPEWLLPTVLPWVARHIEQHTVFDDENARVLPWILRDEAEARRAPRQGINPLSNVGAGAALMGIFVLTIVLDAVYP